jgi:thiol:disulfide interchange protein
MDNDMNTPKANKPSCIGCGSGTRNIAIGVIALIGIGSVVTCNERQKKQSAGAPAAADSSGVQWQEDFAAALKEARETHKPMLVDFSASWCPPCQMMKRDVLPDKRIRKALADFIPVEVDVDAHDALAQKYHIEPIPAFLVLDSTGKEVYRFEGYQSVGEFLLEIDRGKQRLPAAPAERAKRESPAGTKSSS